MNVLDRDADRRGEACLLNAIDDYEMNIIKLALRSFLKFVSGGASDDL